MQNIRKMQVRVGRELNSWQPRPSAEALVGCLEEYKRGCGPLRLPTCTCGEIHTSMFFRSSMHTFSTLSPQEAVIALPTNGWTIFQVFFSSAELVADFLLLI